MSIKCVPTAFFLIYPVVLHDTFVKTSITLAGEVQEPWCQN